MADHLCLVSCIIFIWFVAEQAAGSAASSLLGIRVPRRLLIRADASALLNLAGGSERSHFSVRNHFHYRCISYFWQDV